MPVSSLPLPSRHRFTRDEADALMRAGLLREGGFELIEGDILEKMPKHAAHVNATRRASRRLEALFGRAFVRVQDPIVLSPISEPEPDIAVTRHPEERYADANPDADEARLIVEVSDTTLAFDLSTKASLYARAGIAEYWVIDVNGRRLHRYTEPRDDGYQAVTALGEDDVVSVAGVSVPVAELL